MNHEDKKKKVGVAEAPSCSMDDFFTSIGFGPWNAFSCAMSFLSSSLVCISYFGADFLVPVAEFNCTTSDPSSAVSEDNCSVLFGNSSIEPCPEFVYNRSRYYSTVTMEFNLVCSRASYRHVFELMATVGCVFGPICAGAVSNKFGRQRTIWMFSLLWTAFLILNLTVPVFWAVMITRLFLGFFTSAVNIQSFVLGMESCPIKNRSLVGMLCMLPFGVMTSVLAGVAYYFRSWREIQLLCSIPLFVLNILSNPLLLSESPRWLVTRGRIGEAARILTRAAQLNKRTYELPHDLEVQLQNIYEDQLSNSRASGSVQDLLISLFTAPGMRKITLVSMTLMFIHGALFISIPLRADAFRSEFLYVALLGATEASAYLVVGPIINRAGRIPFICTSLILGTVLHLILIALMVLNVAQGVISTGLSAATYGILAGGFQATTVLASELYPTSARDLGMSLVYFGVSIGYSIPSIINLLKPPSLPWLSLAVFSALAAVGAVLVRMLPETNKQPLLQAVLK